MHSNEATIVEGDNYRVKLIRRGPGDVVFLLEIAGRVCGEMPFDNLVKAVTRIDPDHASAAEKQIQALRLDVAEAKGKLIDAEYLQIQLRNTERARVLAENERRAALSELQHVRESAGASGVSPVSDNPDLTRPVPVQLRPEYTELLLYAARTDGLDVEMLLRMILGDWVDAWRRTRPCRYEFETAGHDSVADREHLAGCPLLHSKGWG